MSTVTQVSVFVALAGMMIAYRMLGVEEMFKTFIKRDLKDKYDYIIGIVNCIITIEY